MRCPAEFADFLKSLNIKFDTLIETANTRVE